MEQRPTYRAGFALDIALTGMELLRDYWWLFWGLAASGGVVWYRLKRRGGDEPLLRRIVFVAKPITDPTSSEYDRYFTGRMVLLVAVGLLLVAVFRVAIWMLQE